jgi:hypothetical protein
MWVNLFGCATAFFHAYAVPVEMWRPQWTHMLGMLGSGIIFSVFKGEGAPETDTMLDFCRSAVGCVSDNACLSEIGKGAFWLCGQVS